MPVKKSMEQLLEEFDEALKQQVGLNKILLTALNQIIDIINSPGELKRSDLRVIIDNALNKIK